MARKNRRSSVTDYQLITVSQAEQRRYRLIWTAIISLLILLALGFGFYTGLQKTPSNEKQLNADIEKLQQHIDGLKRQLSVYQTDEDITSEANDSFRADYKELRNQLSELSEAVSFYKSIMDPADRSEGLHLEHLSLTKSTSANQYNYRLVLTQVGNNKWRAALRGDVHWQLTGQQNGTNIVLDDSALVNQDSAKHFNFRYFQELTGTITLPAGIKPRSLIITAEAKGPQKYVAEQTFKWNNVEKN